MQITLFRAAAALLAVAGMAPRPSHAQAAPAQRPTLVVFITVDQLRPDYFSRYEKQLSGGLKRLWTDAAFFTNAFQDHAITETAPGHSTTMSGRFPRGTGIVFNAAGVEDPWAPLIGGGGPGASPYRFRGSTLTDWIRLREPRARALSVSRKDRAAILPIGRAPEEVYWYASDGRFTTSTYYHDTLPTWVNRFNAREIPQSYAGKSWDLLLQAKEYPEIDSVPVENNGRNVVFPHPFPTDPDNAAAAFVAYPMMDSLTLQFALQGLEEMQLGKGPTTDVLAVSLSSTDAVGHAFGPDSRELHDQILRLDRYFGAFLDSLFKLRDRNRIVLALTADHGVAPYPQLHAREAGGVPRFVNLYSLARTVEKRLEAIGADSSAFQFEENMVYLNRDALRTANVNADSLLSYFADSARKVPGVLRVDLVKDLASKDTTKDYVARRWIHMLPPDLKVELVVTFDPYAYSAGVINATHGTPHDYDAHVPVVLYGPMIKPGKYGQFARVVDLAPTLARIVGVTPTEPLDGRVLTPALR